MDVGLGELAVLALTFGLVFGAACSAIARNKGLGSGAGYFFLGFFLGIIGLIIVACLQSARPNSYSLPVAAAGWYADPWQAANFRWHDGFHWTGNVG